MGKSWLLLGFFVSRDGFKRRIVILARFVYDKFCFKGKVRFNCVEGCYLRVNLWLD